MKKTIFVGLLSFVLGGLTFTSIFQAAQGAKDKHNPYDFGITGYGRRIDNVRGIVEKYNETLKSKDSRATKMYQEILIEQNFVIIGQNIDNEKQNQEIIKTLGKLK